MNNINNTNNHLLPQITGRKDHHIWLWNYKSSLGTSTKRVRWRRVWRYQWGIRKSKKDRQHSGQVKKDKQTTIYRTVHRTLKINTNPTTNRGWSQVLQKGRQFLLHQWHPSCCSSYKHDYKSWMRKWFVRIYEKWNLYVAICDTDIPYRLTKSCWRPLRPVNGILSITFLIMVS